jgi:hypothetical protein
VRDGGKERASATTRWARWGAQGRGGVGWAGRGREREKETERGRARESEEAGERALFRDVITPKIFEAPARPSTFHIRNAPFSPALLQCMSSSFPFNLPRDEKKKKKNKKRGGRGERALRGSCVGLARRCRGGGGGSEVKGREGKRALRISG